MSESLSFAATGPAAVREPGTVPADTDRDDADHLRHIICVLCYPAFDGATVAPHDAQCVCGKMLRKGDRPSPKAAHCILCDELWEPHSAATHPDS